MTLGRGARAPRIRSSSESAARHWPLGARTPRSRRDTRRRSAATRAREQLALEQRERVAPAAALAARRDGRVHADRGGARARASRRAARARAARARRRRPRPRTPRWPPSTLTTSGAIPPPPASCSAAISRSSASARVCARPWRTPRWPRCTRCLSGLSPPYRSSMSRAAAAARRATGRAPRARGDDRVERDDVGRDAAAFLGALRSSFSTDRASAPKAVATRRVEAAGVVEQRGPSRAPPGRSRSSVASAASAASAWPARPSAPSPS